MRAKTLGWLAVLAWVGALMSIDHAIGIRDLVARHHAGVFDPGMSYVIVVLTVPAAMLCTFAWWAVRRQAHVVR